MSSQSYTNRQRVLAEASNTKVQYQKGVSFTNQLSTTINCNPDFNNIRYVHTCKCSSRIPFLVQAIPIQSFNSFTEFNFNGNLGFITLGIPGNYRVFSETIAIEYTSAVVTIRTQQSTTNFGIPYTICTTLAQLAGLNPFATRTIIFNNTSASFTLDIVLPSSDILRVTVPVGEGIFSTYSISGPPLSFTIV